MGKYAIGLSSRIPIECHYWSYPSRVSLGRIPDSQQSATCSYPSRVPLDHILAECHLVGSSTVHSRAVQDVAAEQSRMSPFVHVKKRTEEMIAAAPHSAGSGEGVAGHRHREKNRGYGRRRTSSLLRRLWRSRRSLSSFIVAVVDLGS
nr:hypothetical protein Iba_chr08cCG7280 [Ipomoea batatas]